MILKYIKLIAQAGKPSSNTSNTPKPDYGILPLILATLSSIIWPLSWIYSNQHNITMSQSTIFRGLTNIVVNYCLCWYTNSSTTFRQKPTFKNLIFRSFIMSIASSMIGLAQFILPLSIVFTLVSSTTLFVFIFDYFLFKVKINFKQGIGIIVGMIGVALASNGKLISQMIDQNYIQQSKFQNYLPYSPLATILFTLVFVLVLAAWSYVFVITKTMQYNAFQINYMFGIVSIMTGSILYQFDPSQVSSKHTIQFYKAIIYTGIPLLLDQIFLISALIMSKQSGIISMLNSNSIFVAYLVSVFRYDQKPNIFINIGIILLIFGLYQTIFNNGKQQKKQISKDINQMIQQDKNFGKYQNNTLQKIKEYE